MTLVVAVVATTRTRIPGAETDKKIMGFLDYPVGWHYGSGHPPSPELVSAAIVVNRAASRTGLDTNAFLGTDGEVRVTVYHRDTYLQFTIEAVDSIEYVREEGQQETERRPGLSLESALSILEDFEIELWLSSVSSTASTMITTEGIFRTSPSRLPAAVRVFRSLSGIAPLELALQFVDT
jgi:hypothetical protein